MRPTSVVVLPRTWTQVGRQHTSNQRSPSISGRLPSTKTQRLHAFHFLYYFYYFFFLLFLILCTHTHTWGPTFTLTVRCISHIETFTGMYVCCFCFVVNFAICLPLRRSLRLARSHHDSFGCVCNILITFHVYLLVFSCLDPQQTLIRSKSRTKPITLSFFLVLSAAMVCDFAVTFCMFTFI